MFAVQADGADVTTIEGLAKDGKLHPVQEAFRENHGLQCGFCTPGMIMTAVDMIRRMPNLGPRNHPRRTRRQYLPLHRLSEHRLGHRGRGHAHGRRSKRRRGMIPYAFNYRRAKSLAEAPALLAKSPDAKLLAGGQTLIAAMKMRLANRPDLIDISALKELAFIRATDSAVTIGAATTHFEVATSRDVKRLIPALADLAESIGDPAVRHMGTLGGSLANNDPAADYPAAVLGAGRDDQDHAAQIAADDFFTGMFSTALEDGEIITEVSFPVPERAGYAKFRNPASRYAMAGVFVAKIEIGRARGRDRRGALRVPRRRRWKRRWPRPSRPMRSRRSRSTPTDSTPTFTARPNTAPSRDRDGEARGRGRA